MKPNRQRVAVRLKEVKKQSELSLLEFANRLNLSKGTFNSYLRGVALPPENTVEKITKVANVSKEWVYFGKPRDYMDDYFETMPMYEYFFEHYPNIVEKIIEEFEKSLEFLKFQRSITSENSLKELIQFYNEVANNIFFVNYDAVFSEYVEDLVQDFMQELDTYPIYKSTWSSNAKGFLAILMERLYRMYPQPQMHEVDKIQKIAEEQFELITNKILLSYKDQVNFSNAQRKNKDILEFMSEKFTSYEGVESLLKDLAVRNNLVFNASSPKDKELIELLLTLSPHLNKLNEKI